MELCWIKVAAGLQNGIELINKTDKVKFDQLISHIVGAIAGKAEAGLFTADELLALEKVLNLDTDNVTLLIKSIRHIMKRMVKFIMRPSFILNDLTTVLKMNEDKAQIFIDNYKILTKKTMEEYSVANIGNIDEVTKAMWQVNLEMTSSKNQLERSTSILFNLETGESENNSEHCIEFDIDELKSFHLQLEVIQNELDAVINT